jgi:hypothetical protein
MEKLRVTMNCKRLYQQVSKSWYVTVLGLLGLGSMANACIAEEFRKSIPGDAINAAELVQEEGACSSSNPFCPTRFAVLKDFEFVGLDIWGSRYVNSDLVLRSLENVWIFRGAVQKGISNALSPDQCVPTGMKSIILKNIFEGEEAFRFSSLNGFGLVPFQVYSIGDLKYALLSNSVSENHTVQVENQCSMASFDFKFLDGNRNKFNLFAVQNALDAPKLDSETFFFQCKSDENIYGKAHA